MTTTNRYYNYILIAVALASVVAGCGSPRKADITATGPSDWGSRLDGIPVSGPYSSFVVSDSAMAAVIDGGLSSTKDGRGGLRYISHDRDLSNTVIEMPGNTRRALIFAWTMGDRIAMLSVACPNWGRMMPRPTFDESQPAWLQKGCHNSTFDLWTWSRVDFTWEETASGLFEAPDGFLVSEPQGSKIAILLPPAENLSLSGERIYILDAKVGTMELLPELPASLEASNMEVCILQDESIVVGADVGTTIEETGSTQRTPGETGRHVRTFVLEDRGWRELEVRRDATSTVGCDPEGGLVLQGSGEIVLILGVQGKQPLLQAVELPPEYITVEDRLGGIVMLEYVQPSRTEPETALINLLSGGSWTPLGQVDAHSDPHYIVNGVIVGVRAPDDSNINMELKVA